MATCLRGSVGVVSEKHKLCERKVLALSERMFFVGIHQVTQKRRGIVPESRRYPQPVVVMIVIARAGGETLGKKAIPHIHMIKKLKKQSGIRLLAWIPVVGARRRPKHVVWVAEVV